MKFCAQFNPAYQVGASCVPHTASTNETALAGGNKLVESYNLDTDYCQPREYSAGVLLFLYLAQYLSCSVCIAAGLPTAPRDH